jgi:hypothetical protein
MYARKGTGQVVWENRAQVMASSLVKPVIASTPVRVILLAVAMLFPLACHKNAKVTSVGPVSAPSPTHPDVVLSPTHLPFKFVAYGDIRFSAVDALRERNVSNAFARDAIVDAIAHTKPALVAISGDLVWRGANASDWGHYDQETKPFYDAHLPLLPAIGNHEYLTTQLVGNGRTQGLRNFYLRFPDIPNRPSAPWYSAQYANAYFLLLDSEDDDAPGGEQMKWVQSQLDALPASIEYVFVIIHRPPRTSATDGTHRPRSQEIALGKMLEARQMKSSRPHFVVISGHVHNYERFEKSGVTYIVSGGGGAHPHALVRAADDLYRPANPHEVEFHYCVFTVDTAKLTFEMYRLSDQRPAKFEVRDRFEVPEK